MQPKPTRRRRLKRIALLLGFGSTVAVVAAEVGLRALNAWLRPPIYELDERLGWRHPAHVDRVMRDERQREVRFVTDAAGHRVRHGGDDRVVAAAGPVVLFVGDSFTEASQVEARESFVELVAERHGSLRPVNAGVGGYSTLQQLLALPDDLARHRPSLVVVTVYDNDFTDNLMPYFSGLGPRPYGVVDDGAFRVVEQLDVAAFEPFLQPAPARWWLYRHSAIYRSVHKNLFLPANGDRLSRREHQERDALPAGAQRRAMATLLQRMQDATQAGGATLLIAAIPTREQAAADRAEHHDWLTQLSRRMQVPFVSLLPALHEHGAASAYYAHDIHLTVAGHDCVARSLTPPIAAALGR